MACSYAASAASTSSPLQRHGLVEPRFRPARLLAGVPAFDHAQRAIGRIAVEAQQVLAGFRLPAAAAFAHDDAVGHGADVESGQRHRVGQMAAQLAHRAHDPARRHVGVGQRLRGAQHDQVLEGEPPRAARSARGRDEAGGDQRSDRAARQAQQLLDVPDAVGVHGLRCAP